MNENRERSRVNAEKAQDDERVESVSQDFSAVFEKKSRMSL